MISVTNKMRDTLNVLGAGLWVFLVILSWIDNPGLWYFGLIAVTLITVIYFILGVTAGAKTGLNVLLIYPVFVMALFWVIAFTIAYTTREQAADTWILGLHKGQFWVLFLLLLQLWADYYLLNF